MIKTLEAFDLCVDAIREEVIRALAEGRSVTCEMTRECTPNDADAHDYQYRKFVVGRVLQFFVSIDAPLGGGV